MTNKQSNTYQPPRLPALGLATLLAALPNCAEQSTPDDNEALQVEVDREAVKGASNTLDIASWNIEWFGDTSNGPSDETLQRENAYDVISGADMDIWGVAEIVSTSAFNTLKSQLGYSGFLANDSSVTNGSAYYSSSEQKVGILYKSSIASVQDARIILTSSNDAFAGRPPLQVTLRVTIGGYTEDIVVIVLHAKCCDDTTSWTRRQTAANALKSYLDSAYPTQKVWVIGDFNDDLDSSITPGKASPYASFLNDTADYTFITKALSDAHIATTVGYTDTIDQHLVTNEAAAKYISGSVEAYRVDQQISNYGNTTSDHYPILSRYTWGGSGGAGGTGGTSGGGAGGTGGTAGGSSGGTAQLIINEILANEPGSDTAGEFVEILNIGSGSAILSGYTLSDSSSVRHTFASGTTLGAGQAIVVYGGSSGIASGVSNAVTASTGQLNLANGGDTVTLKTNSGSTVQSYTYSSSQASTDGVSINRSPDGGASGSFVKHNTLSSLQNSPGKRVNGSAW